MALGSFLTPEESRYLKENAISDIGEFGDQLTMLCRRASAGHIPTDDQITILAARVAGWEAFRQRERGPFKEEHQ